MGRVPRLRNLLVIIDEVAIDDRRKRRENINYFY